MAKPDEISSTEKLLRLIRKGGAEGTPAADSAPSLAKRPKPEGRKPRSASSVGRKPLARLSGKGLTVGVDIGETDIKLVAARGRPDHRSVLVNWAVLPLEAGIAKDRDKLARFLKSVLSGFCRKTARRELWGCISSANVETRALKIPKVPTKQLANAVLWAFRKEAAFNEKDDIFDYQVVGEVVEDSGPKLQVMASTAPKQEVADLRRLFARAGHSLTGVSIVPFALQNLLQSGWLEANDGDVCALFIGRDWSRIAIFSQGHLVLSRDIKAGMKSLVQAVSEGIESLQEELSVRMLDMRDRIWEESSDRRMQLDAEQAPQVLDEFIAASENESGATALSEDDLFGMIQPALERIVRQVEMTFEHYYQHFSSRRVQRIYISGQISGQPRVQGYFKEQLGIDLEAMDPFEGAMLDEGVAPPGKKQIRADFVPAVGLSLSQPKRTPNFLFTFKDKARKRTVRRFDAAVLACFALIMVLFAGVSKYLAHENRLRDQKLARLRTELDQFSPRLDKNLVMELAGRTVFQMKHLGAVSQRYTGLAVVNEVARITPERVKLVSLKVELGAAEKGPAKGSDRHLIVDGLVLGDRLALDAVLAEYMMDLDNSPLFQKPSIEKRTVETIEGDEVLRFAVRLTMT